MLGYPLTIWCTFDKENSKYVKLIHNAGHYVIASHIDEEKNFFTYKPQEPYDTIISNPPFSLKDEIVKRLYELNKPYAILLPIPSLQRQKRFPYIKDCQALIFDKRINYYTNLNKKKKSKKEFLLALFICVKIFYQGI